MADIENTGFYRYVVEKDGMGRDLIDAVPLFLKDFPLTDEEYRSLKRAENDFYGISENRRHYKAALFFTKAGILRYIRQIADIFLVFRKYARQCGYSLRRFCGQSVGKEVMRTEYYILSWGFVPEFKKAETVLPSDVRRELFKKAEKEAEKAENMAVSSGRDRFGILNFNVTFLLALITAEGLLPYMKPYVYGDDGYVHIRYTGVNGKNIDDVVLPQKKYDPPCLIGEIGKWENAVALFKKTGAAEYPKYREVVEGNLRGGGYSVSVGVGNVCTTRGCGEFTGTLQKTHDDTACDNPEHPGFLPASADEKIEAELRKCVPKRSIFHIGENHGRSARSSSQSR